MSKSMKELKQELEVDYKLEPTTTVTPCIRAMYFKRHGAYHNDGTIQAWWDSLDYSPESTTYEDERSKVSTGGKTDFYDIIGCKDVDDLAEHWDLKGDEFNCLKAIAGIVLGSRHPGTDPKRDANKLLHYANRIKNRLDK